MQISRRVDGKVIAYGFTESVQRMRLLLQNGPKQNNYAIVEPNSSPAKPAMTLPPAPAPVVTVPAIPAPVANLVGGLFSGGLPKLGNWRLRLLQSQSSFGGAPHSFDTPAGGRFDPAPVTGTS